MKLMGAPRLFEMEGITPAARGACASLRAELEAGAWRRAAAVEAAFPFASWDKKRLVVSLDDQLCAVVAFNYESGIALIEYAGRRVDRKDTLPTRRTARP